MFKKILLGLDGSPESARALDLATKIAADDSAHIDIVHVREYMLAGRAGMQTTRANEDDLEAIVRKQADDAGGRWGGRHPHRGQQHHGRSGACARRSGR